MRVRIIETIEQWHILKAALIEKGYKLWQTQFSYDAPEGYRAWFWKDDKQVEVATHNQEIQSDIVSCRYLKSYTNKDNQKNNCEIGFTSKDEEQEWTLAAKTILKNNRNAFDRLGKI
ncbi:MAG TPA: hypothetical protein P5549_09620 [Syntrophomonas sp.]|nr:hypothetical protein [Syntrophomonas sp.]